MLAGAASGKSRQLRNGGRSRRLSHTSAQRERCGKFEYCAQYRLLFRSAASCLPVRLMCASGSADPLQPLGNTHQTFTPMEEQLSDYEDRYKRGMELLKKMGREELMMDQKALSPDLYEMSVGHLFGDIWSRPGLSLRDRQLVTLAANIALARPTGNFSHYRSSEHIGITRDEIMEVIIQVGHYAGWPTVSNAVRQYTAVIKEDEDIKAGRKSKRELI
jgi:4-carboxymuconolactone decarboxylase